MPGVEQQSQIQRTLNQPGNLARVRALIARAPQAHRTALADQVCAEFGFVDARARGQRAGCLKALRSLAQRGALSLPAPRTAPGPRGVRRLDAPVPAARGVPGEVTALTGLTLMLVKEDRQRRIWNELLVGEHPRGVGPLVGCQLRYLIGSAHGWLGAIGIGAAALQLSARDRWIGWDRAQREAQLYRIVGLNRLLIRPDVHCRNLVSRVLSRLLRRLGPDFEARYGYRPWLIETFVDRTRHTGVSLQASNWQYVGDSSGRGRQDRAHTGGETVKALYVYPLVANWRTRLGVGPAPGTRALGPGEGLDGVGWAEQEFGGAPLGDRRRSQRLVDSAHAQGEQPLRAFTALADWPAAKGYYRLIDQPADSAVTPEHILAPHRERTRQRMQGQATVLCIQDGTDITFTSHPQTAGLGVLGRNQTGARSLGLHLHSTFAVSAAGVPLGVLRGRFDTPPAKAAAATEDKKSFRWIEGLRDCAELARTLPHTRVICVADREADDYALLAEQHKLPKVALVVRAKHDRRLPNEERRLFAAVRATKPRAKVVLAITRRSARPKLSKRQAHPGRSARLAKLVIRYRKVALAPGGRPDPAQPALPVTVVHALELDPPKGERPIEWFVWTTLPVTTPAQAKEVLDYYSLRWRIEDWHRVLKSGCRIDALAHHSADRLERAIAIRMVIAWRVMLLTLLGREVPDLPPELLFSDLELRILGDLAREQRRGPLTQLGQAVRELAILGGYLHRNHDPPPGHQLMWYGYGYLAMMCRGYLLRDRTKS